MKSDLESLFAQAKDLGAEALITTEKDAANIEDKFIQDFKLPIYVAQLEFSCDEIEEFKQLLLQTIRASEKAWWKITLNKLMKAALRLFQM